MYPDHLEGLLQQLRARGYRLTPQRLAIVRLVLDSKAHPSADAIYQQLSPDFPSMSLATVYKTLTVLKELGQVLDLEVSGRSRYDGDATPHPHLICVRCQTILDLPAEDMTLPQPALERAGFLPLWSNLIIHGLCAACQQEPAVSGRRSAS